jgi:hypothetical protein
VFHSPEVEMLLDQSEGLLDQSEVLLDQSDDVHEGEDHVPSPVADQVEEGRISEIDSIVTKKGDWLFNANDYLKYSTAEDWRVLNTDERVDRQTLITAATRTLIIFRTDPSRSPSTPPVPALKADCILQRTLIDTNGLFISVFNVYKGKLGEIIL